MPTPIRGTNTADRKLDYLPDQKEARKIASDLKAQLTGADGRAKSGTLKLMHTSKEAKEMKFERKGAWQIFATRKSKTQPTLKYLVKVLNQAYQLDDLKARRSGDANLEAMQAKLAEIAQFAESHTSISSEQALRFIQDLDAIETLEHVKPFEAGAAGAYSTTAEVARALHPTVDLDKPLGSGNFGAVYDITGTDKVFKELKGRGSRALITGPTVDLKGMGAQWEPGAALLKEGAPVVMTERFIIKNESTGQVYDVPANQLKSFLRHHPAAGQPGAQVLKLIGEVMPKVGGRSLDRTKDTTGQYPEAFSLSDQQQIQTEGLQGLMWMAQRRFIHGDIKPDNLKFDANEQKLKFLDNGALQKVHDLDKAGTFAPGGRTYQAHRVDGALNWAHPKVLDNKTWGPEADLWSFSLTTLQNGFPRAVERLRPVFALSLNQPNADGTTQTPSKWIASNVEEELKTVTDPDLREEYNRLLTVWNSPEGEEGGIVTRIKQGLDLAYRSTTDTREGYDAYVKGLQDLMA